MNIRITDLEALAGVRLPDTELVKAALKHSVEHYPPYLLNHVVRSWLFAAIIAAKRGQTHDTEILAVSVLLHDLGLTETVQGPLRFEVEGATVAREFYMRHGGRTDRAQLLWDCIALHTTRSIAAFKEVEVALCNAGIIADFGGLHLDLIEPGVVQAILDAWPRLAMKAGFKACFCGLIEDKPETAYDNFLGDFGRRFFPEYNPPSIVDILMNAPFDE
jgi:hypothetical protein